MKVRASWKLLCLACLGCQSILPIKEEAAPAKTGPTTVTRQDVAAPASHSAKASTAPTANHLSLAAVLLEKGDDAGACVQLERYLETHPGHLEVRSYVAELLLQQNKNREARLHLELFIAEAQKDDSTRREQIQCHCRLMELAEEEEDDYGVHLHRGIGMYLLALRRCGLPSPKDEAELNCEGLLCKAAAELVRAAALCPDEARPCWYLYAIWWRLAQQHTAEQWLDRAQEAAAHSFLTPTESRQLTLATSRWRIGCESDQRFLAVKQPESAPRLSPSLPTLSVSLPRVHWK